MTASELLKIFWNTIRIKEDLDCGWLIYVNKFPSSNEQL
jgi:hypothetical protein